MNDKEMGKALLKSAASESDAADHQPHLRGQVERLLTRDRRRISWLTALMVAAWAGTLALVIGVIAIGKLAVYPKFQRIFQDAGGMNGPQPQQVQTALTYVVALGTTAVAAAVGLLAVSAICTVILLFASRRATLRQVNARLLELSEQIKAMKT